MVEIIFGSSIWPLKTSTVPGIPPTCLSSCASQYNRGGGRKLIPSCMSVFSPAPQTQQLKNEVMHSVIIMIQEDLKPVSRKAECLGWEGNCFLETLKLCKMERGGCSWMRREVRHPLTKTLLASDSAHGLHLGSSEPEKDLRSEQVVPTYFLSLVSGDTEL